MNTQRIIWGIALTASALMAQIPQSILFQGSLNIAGKAVADGKHKLVLNLCTSSNTTDMSGCSNVTNDSVVFVNGYFTALLNPSQAFDKPYFIEVIVDNKLADTRIPLTATPYARSSAVADSAAKASLAATATKAILADSSLKAAVAAYATKALLADSAKGALRAATASFATTATKATLADSTTGALRAGSAASATYAMTANSALTATLADSSKMALRAASADHAATADTAITANSAIHATLADSAKGALKATSADYATTANALTDGSVTSVNGVQGAVTIPTAQTQLSFLASGDWNDLKTTGIYNIGGNLNTMTTDLPAGTWDWGQLQVSSTGSSTLQIYYPYGPDSNYSYYIRSYYFGKGWSPWKTKSY